MSNKHGEQHTLGPRATATVKSSMRPKGGDDLERTGARDHRAVDARNHCGTGSAPKQPRQEPLAGAFGARLARAFLHDEFHPARARELAPHAQSLLLVRVMPKVAPALLAHHPIVDIDAGDPDYFLAMTLC